MKNANIQFYEGEANSVALGLSGDDGAALNLVGLDIASRALDPSGQTVAIAFATALSIEMIEGFWL